jgi:exosome complex RNA-binding protein Rrp42 (RNase PH superfamily)
MTAASTSREERVTVLDATFAEEQLRSGSFTGTSHLISWLIIVALNKSGEVCWLNKSGGLSFEAEEVLECVRIAHEQAKEWIKYIESEVLKDEQRRNKDKRYVESTAENERYQVPVPQI